MGQTESTASVDSELRMTLAFYEGEKQGGIIFSDMWKLHEIKIPVSINKVLLEYIQAHLFMDCLWLL